MLANEQLSEPVAGLPAVDARGQGGLLDVTLDPQFATQRADLLELLRAASDGSNNTAVARGKFVDGAAPRVDDVQVIYHQSPLAGSRQHYGSRLVWHRDGTLFVTRAIVR